MRTVVTQSGNGWIISTMPDTCRMPSVKNGRHVCLVNGDFIPVELSDRDAARISVGAGITRAGSVTVVLEGNKILPNTNNLSLLPVDVVERL